MGKKNKKYVVCGGLAFTEQKDMEKLSKLASEGWIFTKFANLGYYLEKGEPEDIIYSTDVNENKEGLAEYFEMFEKSGWKYVCSYDSIHFFKAMRGTKPIYTDRNTEVDKYIKIRSSCIKTIPIFIIGVPLFTSLLNKITPELFDNKSIAIIISMINGGCIGFSLALIACIISINITIKKILARQK